MILIFDIPTNYAELTAAAQPKQQSETELLLSMRLWDCSPRNVIHSSWSKIQDWRPAGPGWLLPEQESLVNQ